MKYLRWDEADKVVFIWLYTPIPSTRRHFQRGYSSVQGREGWVVGGVLIVSLLNGVSAWGQGPETGWP